MVLQVWRDTAEIKGPSLDSGSYLPNDGSFNAYDDIKQKSMAQGVPPEEVAYIHDAKTETQKAELFAKVRKGQVRVLLGSTAKMGAGTNVQTRLAALHHLDCPWRPADEDGFCGHSKIKKNVEVQTMAKSLFEAYWAAKYERQGNY